MKKLYSLIALPCVAIMFSSCTEKKESKTIIATIEENSVAKEVKTVGDATETKSFDWNGIVYTATVTRKADKEVKPVKDDDGNRYYENTIAMKVDGPDGSVFQRTFTKGDFESYVDKNYLKPSRTTLMSISFDKVEGPNAYFVVTIGSPNQMDDEYMLVHLAVSKDGGMSLSKLQIAE